MRPWAVVAVLLLAIIAVMLWARLSGFADVPCQDGLWNALEKRCVP